MSVICPKCHYPRQLADQHVHEGICPNCGIAYAKFQGETDTDENLVRNQAQDDVYIRSSSAFGPRLKEALTYVPERVDSAVFWGRLGLYVVFLIWGCRFIVGGVDWESIGGSFLHNVNLPFHEFGHVLFGFLGRFMGILGGSLFQVIFPLVFVVAFCWQRRDNFAAAICLWWSGQNFIDVSPYIADAKYRAIPLIRGLGEEYHDWGNILSMTHSLNSAESLANASFTIGALLMLTSFVWGGYVLWLQYHRRD